MGAVRLMATHAGHGLGASLKGRQKVKKPSGRMMNALQDRIDSRPSRIVSGPRLLIAAGLARPSREPRRRVTPQTYRVDVGSKMHGKVAAVRIVAGNTSAIRIGGMQVVIFRFQMAGEANLLSWHGQINRSRFPVDIYPMADGAPHGHGRVHYLATSLVPMTGGTIVVCAVGVLFDRLRLRSPRKQKQEEADDRLLGAPHVTRRWRAA